MQDDPVLGPKSGLIGRAEGSRGNEVVVEGASGADVRLPEAEEPSPAHEQ